MHAPASRLHRYDLSRGLAVVSVFAGLCFAQAPKSPDEKPAGKTTPDVEKKPDQRADSAGPDVAINGYCPVTYRFRPKPTKGNPAYASTYAGKRYHFASAGAKRQFDEDPERFAPRFGGLCATALGGSYMKRMPADPNVFLVYHDRVYLFSSERARDSFNKSPDYFIARAELVFNEPALNGYCVVSYQKAGKATKGQAGIRSLFGGSYYHFSSADAKKAFEADPETYLPQYDGYCAEGMSRGKEFPGSPQVFAVYRGKTYLLFDEDAKEKFDADPAAIVKKADEQWEKAKQVSPAP